VISNSCGSLQTSKNDWDFFVNLGKMTTKEIKSEIQKTLDGIPENVLQDILDYLKEIQGKSADKLRLSKNLRDILTEDKELLESLAK
jgi:hypothetical protein